MDIYVDRTRLYPDPVLFPPCFGLFLEKTDKILHIYN